ncbi:unnamed protein product, partial [Iphiclides podalirius]
MSDESTPIEGHKDETNQKSPLRSAWARHRHRHRQPPPEPHAGWRDRFNGRGGATRRCRPARVLFGLQRPPPPPAVRRCQAALPNFRLVVCAAGRALRSSQ